VGDVLTFNWSGTHNVNIHPNKDCEFSGSTSIAASSGGAYTLTTLDKPDVYFACQVGSHCSLGQHILVTVEDADGSSPTEAVTTSTPVAAPTAASAGNSFTNVMSRGLFLGSGMAVLGASLGWMAV
jgi:hypothetical protein